MVNGAVEVVDSGCGEGSLAHTGLRWASEIMGIVLHGEPGSVYGLLGIAMVVL